MRVSVVLEHCFSRTPDGRMWARTTVGYGFWRRYLDVFDNVNVVARVLAVPCVPPDGIRADGDGVSFSPLPNYLGPWQYFRKLRPVQRAAQHAIRHDDAVSLRVPGAVSSSVYHHLRASGRPYGVEVVGDPYDGFSAGAIKHPLRPFFRWWYVRNLKRQCRDARACAYVTKHALQRRYPPAENAFTTFYSTISLPERAISDSPRSPPDGSRPVMLIYVGTLHQLYKATDVLIDAVAMCVREGANIRLLFVGDGKHRAELQTRAARLGLSSRVEFLGQLAPGEPVRARLDQADLFVLPSKTEGLPRSMIEAMSRGLPCIGSAVGGIPELLPSEDLVPRGDAAALANKIREVVGDPKRMSCMSQRNLQKARQYTEQVLRKRRNTFYEHLRTSTEVWLKRGKRS